VGFLVYVFFRVTPTYAELILGDILNSPKVYQQTYLIGQPVIRTLIASYGSDFFWMLSLNLGLIVFFNGLEPVSKKIYTAAILAMSAGVIMEALQFFDLIDGTADIRDLLVYFLATILSVFLYRTIALEGRFCD